MDPVQSSGSTVASDNTDGLCRDIFGRPPKIIFDTDMGSDCDDVGALALLHRYTDLGRAEIAACIYSSGRVPYGAGVIDAINRYYGRPDVPIGADHGDQIGDPVDKMDAHGLMTPPSCYGNRIIVNRDAPEQTTLLREILARAEDRSFVYLTVGHPAALRDLLRSAADAFSPLSGRDLIAAKVRAWVAMGALGANQCGGGFKRDWNLGANGAFPATVDLLHHLPVPRFFVAAGTETLSGASLARLPEGTITRDAYASWLRWHGGRTLADQRPSWDLVAVHFVVDGPGVVLRVTGPGTLEADLTAGFRWSAKPGPQPEFIVESVPESTGQFSRYLNEHLAATPRFRNRRTH